MSDPLAEQPYNKRGTCSGNQANMDHVYNFSDRFMKAHRDLAKVKQFLEADHEMVDIIKELAVK